MKNYPISTKLGFIQTKIFWSIIKDFAVRFPDENFREKKFSRHDTLV